MKRSPGSIAVTAIFVGLVGATFAAAIFYDVKGCRNRDEEGLLKEVKAHAGRIAYHDGSSVFVLQINDIEHEEKAEEWKLEETCLRVLWSRDGKTLYLLLDEGGAFDTVHRIEALDYATGKRRVVLALKDAKLEGLEIEPEEIYVSEWAEAEAAEERIVFQLVDGEWYSVEAKRPRVRPEAGRPPAPWMQNYCNCGKHRLNRGNQDKNSWLEVTDEKNWYKITGTNVDDEGAWFCK